LFPAHALKLGANGQLDWWQILAGGGNEVARCVQQTSDGGYVVDGCLRWNGVLPAWITHRSST